jgi:hypothetical protein
LLTHLEKSGDPELITREFISTKSKVYNKKLPRYPRASSLYKDCMRQLVLVNQNKIEVQEFVGFSNTVIFDIGNSVHYWAQNTGAFIDEKFRAGFWKCSACGYTTVFCKVVDTNCPVCGAKKRAFIYKEYALKLDSPYMVTGHPDMFVEKPCSNFRVMEFKTIDGPAFDRLKAPMIEHQWQIQTYMWGIGRDKLAKEITFDSKHAYIMYISKTFKMKEAPIKTFLIKRDKSIIKDIITKLKEFKIGFGGGALPAPHSQCSDTNYACYLAKNCPVLSVCKKSS